MLVRKRWSFFGEAFCYRKALYFGFYAFGTQGVCLWRSLLVLKGSLFWILCIWHPRSLPLEKPFGIERLFILGFMHLAPKDFAFGEAFQHHKALHLRSHLVPKGSLFWVAIWYLLALPLEKSPLESSVRIYKS